MAISRLFSENNDILKQNQVIWAQMQYTCLIVEVYSRSNMDGIWLVRIRRMIFQVGRVIESTTDCSLNDCTFFYFLNPCPYIIRRIFLLGFLIQCRFLTSKGVTCKDPFNNQMSEKSNSLLLNFKNKHK